LTPKKVTTCDLHSKDIKNFYKKVGIKLIEVEAYFPFSMAIKKSLKIKKIGR